MPGFFVATLLSIVAARSVRPAVFVCFVADEGAAWLIIGWCRRCVCGEQLILKLQN